MWLTIFKVSGGNDAIYTVNPLYREDIGDCAFMYDIISNMVMYSPGTNHS
ncbi:MAG: hypothetical protein ACD_80C00077G0003 [uncultured bacterium (gcode 4)]|uniref:Uncharacterized protein n=1 Tax=uncultured bacterium (gcode 4) TaxID=1234023 RepID=K1XYD5_9BACT|nr:MAG: hypothetical protein ACD_80C00077G0003 [uncultured bacterium (gcode 4)]